MYYIAFTLGLLSSFHCVGMCGPLAIASQGILQQEQNRVWLNAFLYNAGRVLSYVFLGVVFGFFGSLLAMTGYQKGISIFSGLMLLSIFFFSVQPDALLVKIPLIKKVYVFVQKKFGKWMQNNQMYSRFILGVLNGFLPCGMVYIALAGALSLQNTMGSMGFMLFFGLGTFPAMVGISLAGRWFQTRWKTGLQKIYPFVSLLLGLYLVYRGIFSSTPLELNFMEALKNPVMCH